MQGGNTPRPETPEALVSFDQLLYASAPPSGPTSAFQPLSVRKIDAGVTNVINARFHRIKPNGPA